MVFFRPIRYAGGMEQAEALTALIAKRVRRLREERKWNAQRLAEEMTAVGVGWNRGVVAKLENGRRTSVSVVELLALGWVFGVPPVVLLLPDDPDAEFSITPTVTTTTQRTYRWLVGQLPAPVAVTTPNEHPGEHAARIGRYLGARPSYMASLDPEGENTLADRVALQDQKIAALDRALRELAQQDQEGQSDG
jgi:transcriptional regulator with XRE-family HTH domain